MPTTHFLLDHLPDSALHRIIRHLQRGYSPQSPNEHTLALADASERQASIVPAAFAFHLSVMDTPFISQTLPLFAAKLRSLDYLESFEHPALVEVLRQPSLHTVKIPCSELYTSALLTNRTVRHLHIAIYQDATATHIIDLIRALPLETLNISCYVSTPVKKCLLHAPLCHVNHESSIPELCPQLHQLQLRCSRDNNDTLYWRLFASLPDLTRVQLNRTVRKHAFNRLRMFESVHIGIMLRDPVYVAERLGHSVTVFRSHHLLERVDLNVLRACPQLTVLHAPVNAAHADELLTLVQTLPSLRSLGLSFSDVMRSSGKRGRGWKYDQLPKGRLRQMIDSAPLLEEVNVNGLGVDEHEMCGILQSMGGRLKELQTSIKGQDEPLFDRLETLMETLGRWNAKLERFSVLEVWQTASIKSNLRRKGRDLAKRRKQQRAQGNRLMHKHEMLKRRTLWSDTRDVESLIRTLL